MYCPSKVQIKIVLSAIKNSTYNFCNCDGVKIIPAFLHLAGVRSNDLV